MYCSISCSRACRSPSSWYRRSKTLSFSAIDGRHLLRQQHPVPVDVHLVDRRLEHAAQAQPAGGAAAYELVQRAPWQRPHPRRKRAVAGAHRHRQLTASVVAVEERVERDLQVLEAFDGEVETDREAA